jgi:GT2 family glycosyltransferase
VSGYRLLDVELASHPGDMILEGHESGIGIIVRRNGRPMGFVLQEYAGGARIPAQELARLMAEAAAEGVVADTLRDELVATSAHLPLPTISIAICTHDRTDGLVRCLSSIADMCARSEHAARLIEVVVVDNAPSTPATRAAVTAMPWVRYVCEPKVGLDFARNRAWRLAAGDVVAFIDDDVVLDECWLDGLLGALSANPDAGVVTGLVLPFTLADDAHVLFERRGGFRRGFVPRRWRGRSDVRDTIYPLGAGIFGAGANMAIRRSVLRTIGGFDEALDTGAPLPGGGDLDIFYRVLRAGEPLVYEPRMSVRHEHRSSVEGLRRQYYTWGLGFFAFLGKVWESEPAERPRVHRVLKWWLLDLARTGRRRLSNLDPTPVDLSFAELAGAVEGFAGEYGRSRRRVAEIHRTTR